MADTPIDTTVAHSARVWNYWLGGKDYYPIDRELGDRILAFYPGILDMARANRLFLRRSVTRLAREKGVRQFLDIGTGLPTENNTHEVAQAHAPESRVVYVDNDPMVLAHARALLVGTEEGETRFVDSDLRDTGKVLTEARQVLDFDQPVALTSLGTMGHITDFEEARSIIRAYTDALPSGSFLALCDSVFDGVMTDDMAAADQSWNEGAALQYFIRTFDQFAGFFDGLELVEPGVVPVNRWRPEPTEIGAEQEDSLQYCGLARKP